MYNFHYTPTTFHLSDITWKLHTVAISTTLNLSPLPLFVTGNM